MKKAASQQDNNLLRPENRDYLALGYVPFDDEGPFDGSVSTSLEYYLADYNIAQLAKALGNNADYELFSQRAGNYHKLFDVDTGMLRPKNRQGEWLSPYDPMLGRNFEPAPGYIEGNAWNYRFYVPHDTPGLIKLLGGNAAFTTQLQATFDTGNFDMGNEPDITYPFLFNYIDGQQWRSSAMVKKLIAEHFTTAAGGIPGNDDTGTLSAWLVYSMLGFYPLSPGNMDYALFQPSFNKVTLHLDQNYFPGKQLVIKTDLTADKKALPMFNQQQLQRAFISHQQLVNGGTLQFPKVQ